MIKKVWSPGMKWIDLNQNTILIEDAESYAQNLDLGEIVNVKFDQINVQNR